MQIGVLRILGGCVAKRLLRARALPCCKLRLRAADGDCGRVLLGERGESIRRFVVLAGEQKLSGSGEGFVVGTARERGADDEY